MCSPKLFIVTIRQRSLLTPGAMLVVVTVYPGLSSWATPYVTDYVCNARQVGQNNAKLEIPLLKKSVYSFLSTSVGGELE